MAPKKAAAPVKAAVTSAIDTQWPLWNDAALATEPWDTAFTDPAFEWPADLLGACGLGAARTERVRESDAYRTKQGRSRVGCASRISWAEIRW